jgi:hypothetical protein
MKIFFQKEDISTSFEGNPKPLAGGNGSNYKLR